MKVDLKNVKVGDEIEMKKPHPCGNSTFQIMRIGMDFRLRCTKCGKDIWLVRRELEKRIHHS